MSNECSLMCPSAQPAMRRVRLLGVVETTADGQRIAYLNEDVRVDEQLLRQAAPAEATEVFRFAAECEQRRCVHFEGTDCQLARRIVQFLPVVVEALPPCLVRPTCRWFEQEGKAACLRCPQIVTDSLDSSAEYRRAAVPDGSDIGQSPPTSPG